MIPGRTPTPYVAAVLARRAIYRHETEMVRVTGLMKAGVPLASIKTHLSFDNLRECRRRADACILLSL